MHGFCRKAFSSYFNPYEAKSKLWTMYKNTLHLLAGVKCQDYRERSGKYREKMSADLVLSINYAKIHAISPRYIIFIYHGYF